jgi:hypothetical protein
MHHPRARANVFLFPEKEANARRIINQGRFLGVHTAREAVEMLWARPLTKNEWDRHASVCERIWQESLKESEMRPPYQLRLAISAVTDEPLSGKNATENAANEAIHNRHDFHAFSAFRSSDFRPPTLGHDEGCVDEAFFFVQCASIAKLVGNIRQHATQNLIAAPSPSQLLR